jgi:hypothetical protein
MDIIKHYEDMALTQLKSILDITDDSKDAQIKAFIVSMGAVSGQRNQMSINGYHQMHHSNHGGSFLDDVASFFS